jgi:hypothetical protein
MGHRMLVKGEQKYTDEMEDLWGRVRKHFLHTLPIENAMAEERKKLSPKEQEELIRRVNVFMAGFEDVCIFESVI